MPGYQVVTGTRALRLYRSELLGMGWFEVDFQVL